MIQLIKLIDENQSFLVKRVLEYAKSHGYTKYTSPLEEAWEASVYGLSKSLTDALLHNPEAPEIDADHDFTNDAMSSFGVCEAKKHRLRGVSLEMFISFMKYYRQAYLDLILDFSKEAAQYQLYLLWINRFFDNNEISAMREWTSITKDKIYSEMQAANLSLTNEKNKYLTIFESTPNPAIILDAEHRCINMNFAAQKLLFNNAHTPGYMYYSAFSEKPELREILPWLSEDFEQFRNENVMEKYIEKVYESQTHGKLNLSVRFHKMLDVSKKFDGIIILLNDFTKYKKIEEQLRIISFHDQLTGLYNRAYMEEEIYRLASGRFNPVGFISIDVDGLKLINDNFGHEAGDKLLCDVAEIIKKCFRQNDVVVRMGGDEFGVLMPACDVKTIQQGCKRISDSLSFYNADETRIPTSLSIGWSVGCLHINRSMIDIIKEADERMYSDKQINHAKYQMIFNRKYKMNDDRAV